MKRNRRKRTLFCILLITIIPALVFAEGAQEEQAGAKVMDKDLTVDLVEVQWTDIASTTASTRIVLEAIGYRTTSKMVSVPIAFQALETGDADVFLGDWEPSMQSISTPRIEKGSIEDIKTNLTGAKYTLAVPTYVAEAGVKGFGDIAEFADKFDRKIYGIEPGNDGNQLIQKMIDEDAFGLGDFDLIASSEAGMLTQVRAMSNNEEWLVFLGWEPHPMNTVYDITYLSGGDDYFGPDYGAATVHTLTRKGYVDENPNLGRFFENLEFTLSMENEIMKEIADGAEAMDAARAWLEANSSILETWLEGVKTVNGEDALPVAMANLGIE
jgi:glycine betaine/proline transport system substrate-binding protein